MNDKAKLTQLTSELLEKTKKKKVRWKSVIDLRLYSTTIKDKFLVSLSLDSELNSSKHDIRLYMWDEYDLLVATVSSGDLEAPVLLEELYKVVQRQAPQNGQKVKDKVTALVETLQKL
jgi:hypothetical protein